MLTSESKRDCDVPEGKLYQRAIGRNEKGLRRTICGPQMLV